MKVIIAKNYRQMSRLAADLIVRQIKKKPSSVLGLATGHTPVELYRDLVAAHRKKRVSFKKVKTFNLDEYVGLDRSDPRSYHSYMKKNLSGKVDLSAASEFILDGQAKDFKKECADFEKKIRRAGGIDLQILGIGLDGHIGFNEPGSSFGSKTRAVKLALSTRKANQKYFVSLSKVPKRALTMGIGTIMRARQIILLAHGAEKAGTIVRLLEGKTSVRLPASALLEHPNCFIIIDKTAIPKKSAALMSAAGGLVADRDKISDDFEIVKVRVGKG